MNANDKAYTTFVTHRGLHQFRVMPFGLVKAPATFNRLMRKLLHGSEFLDNYVDDVLTHTPEYSKPSFGRGYNLQASHPMPGSSSHETETISQTSQNQKMRCKKHQREMCGECLDIPSKCNAALHLCGTEVMFDYGCRIPVIADACKSGLGRMSVGTGWIRDRNVLRDTGCSTVVIKRSLVDDN